MCTVCKLISILNVWMLCYTGSVQTFTAPSATTYKLEVWGASGENCSSHGGLGGYATGKMVLTLNRSIYICNGQAGYLFLGPYSEIHIAYNGGGFGQRIGGLFSYSNN